MQKPCKNNEISNLNHFFIKCYFYIFEVCTKQFVAFLKFVKKHLIDKLKDSNMLNQKLVLVYKILIYIKIVYFYKSGVFFVFKPI